MASVHFSESNLYQISYMGVHLKLKSVKKEKVHTQQKSLKFYHKYVHVDLLLFPY